jgi:hypothetical protein
VPGFEPGTFRMRSGHSTTELHPHGKKKGSILYTLKAEYYILPEFQQFKVFKIIQLVLAQGPL